MEDYEEDFLWWPQQSHYDSVDFFDQPNELVECTISQDHKTLNHSVIMQRCPVNFQFHQLCKIAPAPEHIQSAAFYLAYPFCLGGWSQSLEEKCVDQRQVCLCSHTCFHGHYCNGQTAASCDQICI